MKKLKLFSLCLATVLYGTATLAQHGHSGSTLGGGMGMGTNAGNGNAMAHDTAATDHGNPNTTASHGKTVDDILNNNTQLADKIAKLTGESATTACANFKNLGQCVAAAHVAKNLGISFDCLKGDMTGTAPSDPKSCPTGTGTNGKMSLGKSIQALEPSANSKNATKKGETEAGQDLKGS